MGDGAAPSRYVKLTKDQAPLEEIKPGELNQPIEVPQVFYFSRSNFCRCFFLIIPLCRFELCCLYHWYLFFRFTMFRAYMHITSRSGSIVC